MKNYKSYNYKINWLFHKSEFLNSKTKTLNFFNFINLKSLDIINFLDDDFKIIDNYNNFIMTTDLKKIFKEIYTLLKDDKIKYLELLKK